MITNTKYRQPIHYLLIASIILIQIIIMVFFYNEYFNEKKLVSIENQIQETKGLKKITHNSREELLNAQQNLQKFILNQEKEYLEDYFTSLRKLSNNLDRIHTYKSEDSTLRTLKYTQDEISKSKNFEDLIESTYAASQKPLPKKEAPKIEKIEIADRPPELVDVEIYYLEDSTTKKKKFFPRIADAISGNVDVKRDTAVIITKYKNSVDTAKIKSDFDSTLNVINNHYQKEIKKYESHLSTIDLKNRNLYSNYDQLLVLSNDLMSIYDNKVEDFSSGLQREYDEQNSMINKIRRYSVMGLMLLMFFVLGLLIYTSRVTFLFEKELKSANKKINDNLNFKNRIIGMLSHEIRAPLKIISIFTKRIRNKSENPAISDYLNSIEFTTNSVLIQASQILEYAKNQHTKTKLNAIEFNLRDEIISILKMFLPYIESKNNSFSVQNDIPSDLIVQTDPIKIHQLFINLLGNANKFTENGRIEVVAKTSFLNENTVKFQVSVQDNGVGISNSDLEKIFEPYFQGIISHDIENLGAGLGLSLCKDIVGLFDGQISADSVPGEGTEIRFEINLNCVI